VLSLFLRKDITRAQALAEDLNRYHDQLYGTLILGQQQCLQTLGSPKGLLLSFGAGCLFGFYASHHPEGAKSLSKSLVALTKNIL
jgi:hypothetical protein